MTPVRAVPLLEMKAEGFIVAHADRVNVERKFDNMVQSAQDAAALGLVY
jgi:hypothetical protein